VLPEPMSMVYEEREDETEDGMGEREIKKVSRMLGPTIWGWGYVSVRTGGVVVGAVRL